MAISTNGGSNPTSITYNGKNVTEVWYKSSSSATAIQVWPELGGPYILYTTATRSLSIPGYINIFRNGTYITDYEMKNKGNIFESYEKHDLANKIDKEYKIQFYGQLQVNQVVLYTKSDSKTIPWTNALANTSDGVVNIAYDNGGWYISNNRNKKEYIGD